MASATDCLSKMPPACNHIALNYDTSIYADEVRFRRPTVQQRVAGAGKKKQGTDKGLEGIFPAPLVLPGDDLSIDTRCPPQSLLSWVREKERNEVTPEKNVLYVARSPDIGPEVRFVHTWSNPQMKSGMGTTSACTKSADIPSPNIRPLLGYLKAFYHGIDVRLLPAGSLQFTAWDNTGPEAYKKKAKSHESKHIGLSTSTETIGIRTRPSKDSIFQVQLNLDDLLDTAISILPNDAFALLMLVEYDLFEDEDDDFCCGRAYGGSRVAVVSTARYNPNLDYGQGVEREHAWPASHCDAYMRGRCAAPSKTEEAKSEFLISHQTPIEAAVSAHAALPTPQTPSQLSSLWLSRVCQTASHELGHCFAMDHCVYYACVMQGTASLAEDVRQPPYLCPVDLAKLLRATRVDEEERYKALLTFCERVEHSDAGWFKALGAWIEHRLRQLDVGEGSEKQTSIQYTSESKAGSRNVPIELSP